jgi:hypothetical protein
VEVPMNVLMNITTAATVTVLCVMVYRSLSQER